MDIDHHSGRILTMMEDFWDFAKKKLLRSFFMNNSTSHSQLEQQIRHRLEIFL